jgi:hypothetical protein
MTYIYLIENCYGILNNIYIGKTKIEGSRKNKHKDTFGKQICCTTIDTILSDDKKVWKLLESYWIEQFRQWGFNVQNKNKGGGGCIAASDEMKMKISKANTGKIRTKEHILNYSKPKSESTKLNMSLSRLGKPSPKKGKSSGPNLKLKGRISPNKGPNPKLSASKKGKQKKGVKILDIKNNIIFDSKIKCAKYNTFNINKMRKLLDEGINYKRLK